MDLSIIIINWNSKDYLRECLKSLAGGWDQLSGEILVIDNASYDGVAEMLTREFPQVVFIQGEHNAGFPGGNNRAARQARGEFLLFLNPDTLVEGNALFNLVNALRTVPDAGIAGARLLNTDRTLQTTCVQSFPTVINQVLSFNLLREWFPRSPMWGIATLFEPSNEPGFVEAISGACLMIRRDLFERLGGFDERYFMYSEDIDLCYKLHQTGKKCCYVPTAVVVHHGGGSSQKARSAFSNVMLRESVYRFMRLHQGPFAAMMFRLCIGISALLRLPAALLLWLFRKGGSPEAGAPARKWISILRWSCGMEAWAAKQ